MNNKIDIIIVIFKKILQDSFTKQLIFLIDLDQIKLNNKWNDIKIKKNKRK